MNRTSKSLWYLFIGWFGLSSIGFFLSFSWYLNVRELAQRAREELNQSLDLSNQIKGLLKTVPDDPNETEQQDVAFSKIRASLNESGIPDSTVTDIRILSKTAIPRSQFLRQDTKLTLKKSELNPLFNFIKRIESDSGTSVCSVLDLRSYPGVDIGDANRWDCDLTLTQFTKADATQKNKSQRP